MTFMSDQLSTLHMSLTTASHSRKLLYLPYCTVTCTLCLCPLEMQCRSARCPAWHCAAHATDLYPNTRSTYLFCCCLRFEPAIHACTYPMLLGKCFSIDSAFCAHSVMQAFSGCPLSNSIRKQPCLLHVSAGPFQQAHRLSPHCGPTLLLHQVRLRYHGSCSGSAVAGSAHELWLGGA